MRTGFTKLSAKTSIAIAGFAVMTLVRAGVGLAGSGMVSIQPNSSPLATAPAGTPAKLAQVPWGVSTPNVFQARIKRRIGGIPVIDVTFNRSRNFEMILDTGASGTLVTRSMAAALRLPIVGSVRSGIADGSVVVFPVGRVQSMSIAGAEVKNVDVAIADRMDIGLLGQDFFGRYDLKIKRDVVEFYKR
jgi:aspartyl protease family protein